MKKIKVAISIFIGFILLLFTSFLNALPNFIAFCLKLKIWEIAVSDFIRFMIIIYGLPQLVILIKKRKDIVMNIFTIIKRNKITILGYLTIIIVDLIILGITNICLKYQEVAIAVFEPLGLVQNGVVNQAGVYSIVAGLLTAITGINIVATSKVGWESKEEYQNRIVEVENKEILKEFIKEINKRIDSYKSENESSLSYSSLFTSGIKMSLKEKQYITESRDEILVKFIDNQDYMNIVAKEIFRIEVEEEVVKIRENIKW